MSRPAKVAWISCVGEKGGAETLMIECLRALDRTRFTPHVIQLRPGPLTEALRAVGATVSVLPAHRLRNPVGVLRTILAVRRLALKHDFRLLHSNGFRAHIYGGLAARWAGVPEVWTTFTIERPGLFTRAVLAIPTRQVLPIVPRTDDFFRAAGLPTTLIWPGVAVAELERGTPRAELAARYGLPAERRWVSVGARLQRYKGQHHFLRALAALPPGTDAHGIVIGGSLFGQETEFQRELRALAAELAITGRVTFTGFVPDADLAGLLGASALVVHPALEEDFGLTVAEAQALRVPVVAYATVGPAAILVHGETGWLAPVGNEPALAAALREALADPARLRRFGEAGRTRVLAHFSAERHARLTETAYERALATRDL